MKILRDYIPELTSGMITLIFGILFLILRPNPSDGYIVLAVGAQLTATLSLLKSEIINKFDERLNKLELFELLENIRPELQYKATRAIRDCKISLQELSNGIIVDNASSIFNMLSDDVNNSKYEVLAVHVAQTLDNFEVWDCDYMQNYYDCNKRAVKRRVDVQRIFIIDDKIIHDPQTQVINKKIQGIMEQQQNDGIKVFVISAMNVSHRESFAVIDERLVEYSSYINLVSHDLKSKLSFNSDDIYNYHKKFFELKRLALTLHQWLERTTN